MPDAVTLQKLCELTKEVSDRQNAERGVRVKHKIQDLISSFNWASVERARVGGTFINLDCGIGLEGDEVVEGLIAYFKPQGFHLLSGSVGGVRHLNVSWSTDLCPTKS